VEATANSHTQFSKSIHPGRFTSDIGHIGPIAGVEEFERQQVVWHAKAPAIELEIQSQLFLSKMRKVSRKKMGKID